MVTEMVRAPWTYELPPTGSFAENLDDYEARSADGAHVGVVTGLVERGGDLYLLVDAGPLPPLLHRRLAFRWTDVAGLDHDALVVELAVDRDRVEEAALELDPALARHDPGADAARVHELPAGSVHSVAPGTEGPVDRASGLVALTVAALCPYTVLVIVAIWSARGLHGWEFVAFAAPALFLALAIAVLGYRLYREPHAGRHLPPGSGGGSGGPTLATG